MLTSLVLLLLVGDYTLLSGPGCDSPEAVRAIYPLLDAMPDNTPLGEVLDLFQTERAKGVLCEIVLVREPLEDMGVVGTFISADGTVMDIIKYDRPDGKPSTYSWRKASGASL